MNTVADVFVAGSTAAADGPYAARPPRPRTAGAVRRLGTLDSTSRTDR
ncbi:hypothetical protein RKE29_11530 [Streptomyces sp. B1866]|nr:hypothetical protein [Streptomyces sp. B1866]MDT3397269.1 hypothetical protein [Streptomyces sp. B1866]